MIDVSAKVTKFPDLKIDMPGQTFYTAVALDVRKGIRKNTESKGIDVAGSSFRPYSKQYAKYRAKKGRSTKPNLSFTGKMLGSIRAIGRKDRAIISLSGEQGFKGWANEGMGREFFDVTIKDIERIFKRVDAWMKRENKLK